METDCLIIGGGPAGLVAATYLGRFRRNVVLIDSGASRAAWIPRTHNVMGFTDGVTGPDLLRILQKQADQFGARRIKGTIKKLEILNTSFVADWEGEKISAAKVLLATGGLDVEPEMENARAAVEAGLIRHRPICDAYEACGKKIALVAYGECRINEALLIRRYTRDLTVLTLGHSAGISSTDEAVLRGADIRIVFDPIKRLSREDNGIAAWPASGGPPRIFDTVYSALGIQLRSELAIGLGADTDADGALLVDRHLQTSVPGLYAAGDVVHGLSQVNVAAGQAAIAATAINSGLPVVLF